MENFKVVVIRNRKETELVLHERLSLSGALKRCEIELKDKEDLQYLEIVRVIEEPYKLIYVAS